MRPMNRSRVRCLEPCLFLMGLFAALPNAAAAADAEFTIEARDFDGGNARVSLAGQQYADGPSCIWNAGELPNWAEYEIEFPVTADYTLSALYAAAQARPVEIKLDDKQVYTGFKGVTGNWTTSSAKWEEQCRLPVTRGTHTIALRCEGPFPHICALRLKSSVPFPEGWQLPRPTPEQRAERVRRAAQRRRSRLRLRHWKASIWKLCGWPSTTWTKSFRAVTTLRHTGRP